ncbi:MAG: histidinol dehydrogenase, partial [Schwartzia sp.]|nr:histidinol dehydrogenase [Schwartzia sp. (in: firmicutes)]
MRIVNVKDCGEQEVERLLRKAAFDEVELSPAIREGNKKLFGADLTAAEVVAKIVGDVRREGDAAVMRYTKLIDRTELTPDNFVVSQAEFKEAETLVDGKVMESLRRSIANVRRYHEEQKPKSWMTYREEGSLLGQSVLPLDRVGLYVPGGTAAYPSSVV